MIPRMTEVVDATTDAVDTTNPDQAIDSLQPPRSKTIPLFDHQMALKFTLTLMGYHGQTRYTH